MISFSKEETKFINSLHEPVDNVDMKIINSIIDKMITNKEYDRLIGFLDTLNDFAKIPENLVDKLINDNNKECISEFLNSENTLYFLNVNEINKLKDFINVKEIFIKLPELYDFYYKLLFKQGFRCWKSNINKVHENLLEHEFIKNNCLTIKLIEKQTLGVVVSCVDYLNYDLTLEEQTLKNIDYLNLYGFNIEKNINNKNIIGKSAIYD